MSSPPDNLLMYCADESKRLDRMGAAQLSGFTLHQRAGGWRGKAISRALLGYLVDRVVISRARSNADLSSIPEASVWRSGHRSRRLVDLANDLATGRRDHWALQGLAIKRGGPSLDARSISALAQTLEKTPQRQNLSRLFALAERLEDALANHDARELIAELDHAFDDELGTPKLFTWAICSRFTPITFSKKLLSTRASIASLYMSDRAMRAYLTAPPDESRGVRVALLIGLRELNTVMGWETIGEAFPERLMMTQRDRSRRDKSDDDDGNKPANQELLERIEQLAARTQHTPEDRELWARIADDQALFDHYSRARTELEERAEALTHGAENHSHHTPQRTRWLAQLHDWRRMTMNKPAITIATSICAITGALFAAYTLQQLPEDQPPTELNTPFVAADIPEIERPITGEVATSTPTAPEDVTVIIDSPTPAPGVIERDRPLAATDLPLDARGGEEHLREGPKKVVETLTSKVSGELGEEQRARLQKTFTDATQEATMKCLTGFVQRGKSFSGDIVLSLGVTHDDENEELAYELDSIDTRGSTNSPLADFDRASYDCWAKELWQVRALADSDAAEMFEERARQEIEVSYSITVKGKEPTEDDTHAIDYIE